MPCRQQLQRVLFRHPNHHDKYVSSRHAERNARLATNASTRSQALLFAQNFLKHPKMIGSLIPSSRRLIDRLLGKVDWNRARVIVEYGPGVGTITRERFLGECVPTLCFWRSR